MCGYCLVVRSLFCHKCSSLYTSSKVAPEGLLHNFQAATCFVAQNRPSNPGCIRDAFANSSDVPPSNCLSIPTRGQQPQIRSQSTQRLLMFTFRKDLCDAELIMVLSKQKTAVHGELCHGARCQIGQFQGTERFLSFRNFCSCKWGSVVPMRRPGSSSKQALFVYKLRYMMLYAKCVHGAFCDVTLH